MGKINKNNIKTKLIAKNSQKNKVAKKMKSKVVSSDTVTKNRSKLLLTKTIAAKKTTSKKEKYLQKRKNLMEKFSLLKKQQKEEKARKNREKTAVIGDMKPLKDALPSLDEIYRLSKEKNQLKTGVKEFDLKDEKIHLSAKQKIRKKKEKFVKQVKSFQAILKDPEFKKNPREAIRYHIQYTHGLLGE